MNFKNPVEFDTSKAIRFYDLKVGELFIAVDGSCGGKKYSERVYCKTLPFGDECLGNNGNAVGVTEKYRAYMMAPEMVIRIKATDWEVADDDEAL